MASMTRLSRFGWLVIGLSLIGCHSTESLGKSKAVTTKVHLEKSQYPKTIGEDAQAYDVAVFVKNRTDFARKLYQDGRLDDCITVLRDLVKFIPDSIKNRYDLGFMLFQRASPFIKEYNEISKKVHELAKTSTPEEADQYTSQLEPSFEKMAPDLREALTQFTIYASARRDDSRPIDFMWRCQLALGDYIGARTNLMRMIRWPNALPPETRRSYEYIVEYINDVLISRTEEVNTREDRGLGPGR